MPPSTTAPIANPILTKILPNEEEMLKPYEVKACKKRAEEIEDYINGKLGIKSRKEWEAFVEEEKQDPDSTYYSDPANNIVPKDDWIRDFESKPRVCCIFETDVDYDSYDDDREYSYITYDYYFTLHVGCLDRDANHGRPSIYAKDIRISLCASRYF